MSKYFPSNPYVYDILHQPEAFQNTLDSILSGSMDHFYHLADDLRLGKINQVVLTGMGSSYHALHPIYLDLLTAGISAQMIETSELIHHAQSLVRKDNVIVAVSQSGASAEVLELIKMAPAGLQMVGITNNQNTPLAERSDHLLLTHAGEENSVSCKTYITALVALTFLKNLLTGQEFIKTQVEFQNLPDLIATYLSNLDEWVDELETLLHNIQYLILAGRGSSLASAGTGGLIIKESAHFPAEGMSSAAFRHGPMDMISSEIFILVFEGQDPTSQLNRKLVDEIRQLGGRAAIVGPSSDIPAFKLPAVPSAALPVLEILPVQMISLALAKMKAIDPGQFKLGSKVTRDE